MIIQPHPNLRIPIESRKRLISMNSTHRRSRAIGSTREEVQVNIPFEDWDSFFIEIHGNYISTRSMIWREDAHAFLLAELWYSKSLEKKMTRHMAVRAGKDFHQ